jgi:hypothetical protein
VLWSILIGQKRGYTESHKGRSHRRSKWWDPLCMNSYLLPPHVDRENGGICRSWGRRCWPHRPRVSSPATCWLAAAARDAAVGAQAASRGQGADRAPTGGRPQGMWLSLTGEAHQSGTPWAASRRARGRWPRRMTAGGWPRRTRR